MPCGCNSQFSGLRTPGSYVDRARLTGRVQDWQKAALAMAAARAYQQGDRTRAARGLQGLRELNLADAPTQNLLVQVASQIGPLSDADRSALNTASTVISAVSAIFSTIASLTNDNGVKQVAAWVRTLVSTGTSATISVDPAAIREFCKVANKWEVGLARAALETGTNIAGGLSNDGTVIAVSIAVARINRTIDTLCAAASATIPEVPMNPCDALACTGTGAQKILSEDGATCRCVVGTATPATNAKNQYLNAVRSRYAYELILKSPGASQAAKARAQLVNCRSSCNLLYWSGEVIRLNGSLPATIGNVVPAGGTSPLRAIDGSTLPSGCDCSGGGSGNGATKGATTAVVAGAGLLALFMLLR